MLEVCVRADKGKPCAGKCSLGGDVLVGGVGQDSRYAVVGGEGEQRRERFGGVAVSPSGRCQAVANFHAPAAGWALEPAAAIREWAITNNMACPSRGMLPRAVLDAYAAAHTEEGAA